MNGRLLALLSDALGPAQAASELRWMNRALDSRISLQDMVARRLRGEPLQYILGIPVLPMWSLCSQLH